MIIINTRAAENIADQLPKNSRQGLVASETMYSKRA